MANHSISDTAITDNGLHSGGKWLLGHGGAQVVIGRGSLASFQISSLDLHTYQSFIFW